MGSNDKGVSNYAEAAAAVAAAASKCILRINVQRVLRGAVTDTVKF